MSAHCSMTYAYNPRKVGLIVYKDHLFPTFLTTQLIYIRYVYLGQWVARVGREWRVVFA